MDAEGFLRAVWPEDAWYCIAVPLPRGGYDQVSYNSIPAAAAAARVASASGRDVYFNVHAMKADRIYDPKAKDEHGTVIGKWRVRTHANMKSCKCFFSDVDVGASKPYKTREDALKAIIKFVADTKLPKPCIVSSGGGFHIYWLLTDEISSDDWFDAASILKKLAVHFGFHIDPARTTDRSSVLRVVGTLNFKDRSNPRRVEMKGTFPPTDTAQFLAILDRNSVFVKAPTTGMSAETTIDAKAVTIVQVGKACGVVQELVRTAATHSEPVWHAFLGLMHFIEDGEAWAHKISAAYPTYDRAETQSKFERVMDNQTGPTRCQRFFDLGYSEICNKCWYSAHREQSSPTVASRRMERKYDAAVEIIPPPPDPYKRLEVGGVAIDQDEIITVISPFDLYPSGLIEDQTTGERVMNAEWSAELPNSRGVHTFRMPLRSISDTSILAQKLADKGVVLQHDDLKHVRHYMVAYIQKLQQSMQDNMQHTHLGWTEDRKDFVLPDMVYTQTGQTRKSLISDSSIYATRHVHRKGTKEKQIELLKFYSHPDYVRQQFMIGCGFAAAIFYMTGHHGVIVNAQGESGGSKSTTLFTAASLWGDPESFTINGTEGGATANGRGHRLSVLSNLPVLVDEITYMDHEDAKNLALSISQKSEKIRLDKNLKEQVVINDNRSTIMICSSNGSLHEKLSHKNIAGVASSMRIFEIDFPRMSIHTKPQADAYLRDLNQNFGWLGPEFIGYVVTHQFSIEQQVIATMKEVDERGSLAGHERFHSAAIAATIVALRIAKRLGFVTFDVEAILKWVMTSQLSAMRGVIEINYADPVDQLIGYINASRQDMLIVNTLNGRTSVIERPTRMLGLRYELDTMKVTISIQHLKSYCSQRNMPLNNVLTYVEQKLKGVRSKVSLGSGVPDLSFGQIRAIELDLRNEAIIGKIDFATSSSETNVVELKRSVTK